MQNELVDKGCREDEMAAMVLELDVNNHAGVMSHVCNLFSRRAFNLEGVICIPIGSGKQSRMWLQVNEREKLQQVVKQVQKLQDVKSIKLHAGGHAVFTELKVS